MREFVEAHLTRKFSEPSAAAIAMSRRSKPAAAGSLWIAAEAGVGDDCRHTAHGRDQPDDRQKRRQTKMENDAGDDSGLHCRHLTPPRGVEALGHFLA